MISIHTNLSSIIAQESLKGSTNKLNLAVERMTTGYKINHAKDNAANYSISTNMTTKLGAYDIAQDNVLAGMDLVATASDTLSMMQDKASRLHALSTQARNGTYGAQSLNAINSEANAIMAEITRLYMTSQYNGIDLFSKKEYTIAPHLPTAENIGGGTPMPEAKAEYNGFIANPKTYTDAQVAAMTKLETISDTTTISSGKYSISSVDELVQLAEMTNDGKITGGEFVLGADIDLASIENWTPIGRNHGFRGTFDGNGHIIKNLKINRPTENKQGLFGFSNTEIKNVGVVNCDVTGRDCVGGLAGDTEDALFVNCYVTGNISGNSYIGGLSGDNHRSTSFISSYTNVNILAKDSYVGGLAGNCFDTITNCYATGNVTGDDTSSCVGGLIGSAGDEIINSYATGNVTGEIDVGGLAGNVDGNVLNCYATGNVTGEIDVGGLAGEVDGISNSYATGNVTGQKWVGGLAGNVFGNILNCYATGNVTGEIDVGGLAGNCYDTITNCYATGNVNGQKWVGGLTGDISDTITNCYATGNVSGNTLVGGLAGEVEGISNSYATGNVTGNSFVGGLAGQAYADAGTITIQDSVSYSWVKGADSATTGSFIGGVVNTTNNTTFGTLNITNCQSRAQDMNKIGGVYKNDGTASAQNDMTDLLAGISDVAIRDISTNLQVGINSESSSQISFNTNFDLNFSLGSGIESLEAFNSINSFIDLLSEKQTQLGAVENRLESALDSITVNIENLASSRSTIRDADMAELSSEYIKMQILQEASATLLATANQSPAVALQLI